MIDTELVLCIIIVGEGVGSHIASHLPAYHLDKMVANGRWSGIEVLYLLLRPFVLLPYGLKLIVDVAVALPSVVDEVHLMTEWIVDIAYAPYYLW